MTSAAHWRLGLVVAAALAASLLVKAAGIGQLVAHDEPRFVRDLAAALREQGYTVATGSGNWWAAGLVTARKGKCTVQLRSAALYGQDREAATRRRMTAGPLVYLQHGSVRPDYPRFRSEFAWRAQRELGRIGIGIGVRPPIAVAAQPDCLPGAKSLGHIQLHLRDY